MICKVALKINRREKRYEMAAMREIKTIVTLHKRSGGKWYTTKLEITLSSSITDIIAWFNLQGYVFEVLPFMNKNLYEILSARQFKPFDVLLVPQHSSIGRDSSLIAKTDGFFIRKDAQLLHYTHRH